MNSQTYSASKLGERTDEQKAKDCEKYLEVLAQQRILWEPMLDNIVAFWVPEKPPAVGEPVNYAYRLHWFMETQSGGPRPPAGYTVAGLCREAEKFRLALAARLRGEEFTTHPMPEAVVPPAESVADADPWGATWG